MDNLTTDNLRSTIRQMTTNKWQPEKCKLIWQLRTKLSRIKKLKTKIDSFNEDDYFMKLQSKQLSFIISFPFQIQMLENEPFFSVNEKKTPRRSRLDHTIQPNNTSYGVGIRQQHKL